MVIDVHAHYYPRPYLEGLGRPDLPPREAAPLADLDLGERLALMDDTGIHMQVLSVAQAQPYLTDRQAAAEAARLANELFSEACRAHPDRFRVFATLPLPHVAEALDEIGRAFRDRHVVGVTVGCSINGQPLDDPRWDPVWAELDRRRAVVFLHPVGLADAPWLRDYGLVWQVGAPFEDTVAALRLVQSGLVRRFPQVRIIVPHLGGVLPFLEARLGRQAGRPDLLEDLRRFYYDTVNGSAPALRAAATVFGADRLLFGTDYPYCSVDDFQHHLSYLAASNVSTADVAAMRGRTAAVLLALTPEASSPR